MARICPVCQQRAVSVLKLAVHNRARCDVCQSEVSLQLPGYGKALWVAANVGILFGLLYFKYRISACLAAVLLFGVVARLWLPFVAPLKPYVAPLVRETVGMPASPAFWWTFSAIVLLCVFALRTLTH